MRALSAYTAMVASSSRAASPAKPRPSHLRNRLKLNAELLPHHSHLCLRSIVHHDLVRPLAREAFFVPLPRRVDAHLRAVREPAAGVIEHVDRPHREANVALGVDMIERDPPGLLRFA